MPDDIRKIRRGMVEGSHFDAYIVGGGDECVARTQTGANNPQLFVALLLQPVEAAADIEHALARRIERTANVCRNCIISSPNLGRPSNVVIGHAEPQHGNPEAIQYSTERVMAECVGIPLW